jgi:transcriptional regulator with XRE-family HTH domain
MRRPMDRPNVKLCGAWDQESLVWFALLAATFGVGMMPAKPPNPIDTHVGSRVRMRRVEVDMPQQILGGHLGLTFQQIQKYEKGMNRIGASRLQQIGKILEVPVAFFFEGAPDGWEGASRDRTPNVFLDLLGTRDGQALALSFAKIKDVTLRRSIVDLVRRLACLDASEPSSTP